MHGNTQTASGIAHETLTLSADRVDGPRRLPAEGRYQAVPVADDRFRFKAVDLDASALEFTASVGTVEGWLADGVAAVVDAGDVRTFEAPEWASA